MMGRKPKVQNKLFYTAVNLEQRVRKDHILRAVKRYIDFDFIYKEVKDKYGINGNESVAPTAAIQNIKILLKNVKEPGAALQMRVAAKAAEQASRTKSCGLLNLFNPIVSNIARFCRILVQSFALPSYADHRLSGN